MSRRTAVIWMLWALLALSATAHATTIEYIHTDALGSIVAVTDATGAEKERREWEPYGEQLTPAPSNGPGYTGHVQDASTGLVYMQQRYYDPVVGRFLSVDPVAADTWIARNFNRYAYAYNNPYKFTDPDGRENVLGVQARFGIYVDSPTAPDHAALADVQRSVDLTVGAVMASGDQAVIADAKVWSVEYDPSYTNRDDPSAYADTLTVGSHGSADDPKEISTTYTARFADAVNAGGKLTTSDGITSVTKDAKLLVIGAHELSHGSEGNRGIEEKRASERDVGPRVREIVRHSPAAKDGIR